MNCGLKLQHINQTSKKKVLLFQYVIRQWFLFKPTYSFFFLSTAESFCLWWKLLNWLTCWNRREISLCLPQVISLLPLWPTGIWPCWRVGLPDSFHLLILVLINRKKRNGKHVATSYCYTNVKQKFWNMGIAILQCWCAQQGLSRAQHSGMTFHPIFGIK